MKAITTYLFTHYHHAKEARWFKKAMAFYALYKCLYWLLDFKLLFSDTNIIYHNNVNLGWWRDPVFFLFNHPSTALAVVFIGLTVIASLLILYSARHQRFASFLLWFCISNINNNVFCTLSGGDCLYQHLLFFTIFLSNDKQKGSAVHNDLDIALHNFGVIALQLQICMVYFLAGYAKLLDADWVNGTAVSDVFKVYDFSLPALYESRSVFNSVLNYLVIWYQLFFPFLVWVPKLKKWYLLIGVLQHLFIAFIIGLPSFGLIMILAYLIFYVPVLKTEKT